MPVATAGPKGNNADVAKCTALKMDVVTKKSGHQMTGMAVSVCLTPAAPSPLPIPYPTMGTVAEGITDPCMRTKIGGAIVMTVGSCMSKCHGNEPGTLKEVVSLNTAGPCFPALGAPIVIMELGMAGITGSIGQMNKSITVGASGSASGAGGSAGGGGGGGGSGSGPGGQGTQGPGGGGGDGGGSSDAAAPPDAPAPPEAEGQAEAGHPVDVVTGTMFTRSQIDLHLPGPLSLQLGRTYYSSAVRSNVGVGWGWTHNLAWRAERQGELLVIVDDQQRETTTAFPSGDEVLLLPFGRQASAEGTDVLVRCADGIQRVLRPDADSRRYVLAELRDDWSNVVELSWDEGELVGIVDCVGRRASLELSGNHRIWNVTVVDENGNIHQSRGVSLELDDEGDLISVIDAGGAEWRYTYDSDHYLLTETQPDGVVFHFRYQDVAGQRRCVETWGERPGADILQLLGRPAERYQPRGIFHTQLEYAYSSNETKVTDAEGNVHRYIGNRFGLVERYVDPRGYATILRYDDLGKLVAVAGGGGGTTVRRFDPSGQMSAVVEPGGSTIRYLQDDDGSKTCILPDGSRTKERYEGGRVVERIDARGRKIAAAFNDRGRNVSLTRDDGTTDTLSYDAHGNVTRYEAAGGQTYAYRFDLFGLPVAMTTPTGASYELEYDSRGDITTIVGPGHHRASFQVDAMRRVEVRRHAGGGETVNRWVSDALVEQIAPDGGTWRMGYDALLRLRWIENPAGERFSVSYDGAGNPVQQTTFAGQRYGFRYDGDNRLIGVLRPDETEVVEERDPAGRVLAKKAPSGTSRFQYDAVGRLLVAETPTTRVEYGYDEHGQLVEETQSAGAWRFGVRYRYDEQGRLVARRYGSDWSVELERDPSVGSVASMAMGSGEQQTRILFERDVVGRERLRRLEGGPSIATERDPVGFTTKIEATSAEDEPLFSRSFDWHPIGPLASVTDGRRGERRYDLDPLGRPTSVRGLGARAEYEYASQGTPLDADASTHVGAGGRPTRIDDVQLSWDTHGRLVERAGPSPTVSWRYTYDDDHRLTKAERGDGLEVEYLYDALGRRIAETSGGSTTYFGWDGNSVVEESLPGGHHRRRVFDQDGYTPIAEARDDRWHIVAHDAASTPFAYVAADDEVAELELDPWGEVAHREGDVGSLRFAGQRADSLTGLHYNRNRYYAPDLHVYTTPDPLGLIGSFFDVGFVPNVTLYIDPLGLLTIITASNDPNLKNAYYGRYASRYPGATILTPSQVTPGSLSGETEVMIDTHGTPGNVEWAGQNISGSELGDKLNAAGFNGNAPGARVDVIACNSATDPIFGRSVAQSVANRTGAEASGGRALGNSAILGHLGMSGLVSGMPSGNPPSGLSTNGYGSYVGGIQPQPGRN